jgi:predicted alpha/beta-fold hydrolase
MYKNIAIVALILLLFLLLRSKGDSIGPGSTTTVTVTKIDTFIKVKDTTIFKKGKDIQHDSTIYVEIPTTIKTLVDTLAILKDYFSKTVYRDTLKFSEGTVIITDLISENKIQARAVNPKINQKTVIVTNDVTHTIKPKAALYWGLMGTKQDNQYGYGGGLMYKSANKGVIQLNLTNNNQIQLGYYSKIF